MLLKKLSFVLIGVLMLGNVAVAQTVSSNVRDGIYDRFTYKERKILTYDHIREADVFWEKRIWRVIDLREKMNLPFTYPIMPFITILLNAAKTGEVTVYNGIDDNFTTPITPDELAASLSSVDTIPYVDPITYEETIKVVPNDFNPDVVKKFRLKEDWVFDEESSTLVVRILGIAPIMDKIDDEGNFRGEMTMFWAYYPDLRPVLVHFETFNPFNDGVKMTWEDIFEMRMFSSYIYKESNVYDRKIKDYSEGVDRLYEGERIKQQIFEKEHDLWHF
jgi:gliding motility associated protien GldN